LNNPLTARRMIDDELQNALSAAGYSSQPLSSHGRAFQTSFSPVTTQPLYPASTTYQFPQQAQTTAPSYEADETSTVEDPSYQPLEQFSYGNISWAAYKTDEGHIYYLDTASQHSQWDDPRVSGVIYYEREGEGDSDNSTED
jgi:hypothetical protein